MRMLVTSTSTSAVSRFCDQSPEISQIRGARGPRCSSHTYWSHKLQRLLVDIICAASVAHPPRGSRPRGPRHPSNASLLSSGASRCVKQGSCAGQFIPAAEHSAAAVVLPASPGSHGASPAAGGAAAAATMAWRAAKTTRSCTSASRKV